MTAGLSGLLAALLTVFTGAACSPGPEGSGEATRLVFDPRTLAAGAAHANSATGSFTAAGTTQTATLSVPDAPMAQPGVTPASARLVVTSPDGVVMDAELGGAGYLIAGTIDTDRDGVDEIVLFGSDMRQGIETGWITLASLEGGVFNPVERFDRVWIDPCASGEAVRRGLTVHVHGGPDPVYTTEPFSQSCPPTAP